MTNLSSGPSVAELGDHLVEQLGENSPRSGGRSRRQAGLAHRAAVGHRDRVELQVHLGGEVERRVDAELLERFTAAVPGVVSVDSELRWKFDEPKLPAGDPRVPQPPR